MTDPTCMTAADLAERLGGDLSGDGALRIRVAATLENAGPDAVSWIGAAKHASRLTGSDAGACLVPRECEVPAGRTVIRVDDPDVAMCEAQRLLGPPPRRVEPGVHADAMVSPDAVVAGAAIGPGVFVAAGAVIGRGTQLHPGVYVGPETRIGCHCVLWPNVVIRERVSIGDRVIIHPNTTIGADGFGYLQRGGENVKIPQTGSVVIEDDVEIGANSAVDRARMGVTRIGRGTKIDNLVQIAHNVDVGEHCVIAGLCGLSGSTTLGPNVMLGGSAGLVDHIAVGEGARVAASSTVYKNVEPGKVVSGYPAVDHRRFLRQHVSLGKLPGWLERLRALERRVRDLEPGDGAE